MQVIGVDTGGTFTDTVVICPDGRVGVGKALSVPSHPERGVVNSVADAAASLNRTLAQLLSETDILAHGTTVGLNAILTKQGARVGLLTTEGFESTLAIAKANKVYGLSADELTTPTRWSKPELLVPRDLVRGVDERVDADGAVIRPLDLMQAEQVLRDLLERDVDALAIALLWSIARPDHERQLAALAKRIAPELHISVSSELAPRLGEYERTATVVVDGYVGPLVAGYLDRLERVLTDESFRGRLLVMRMGGGIQPLSIARRMPVTTLHSGPIGGVAAARQLGAVAGHRNIVTTDVGGTSFDVGLVIGDEIQYSARPMVDRHPLGIPVVDVTSIGIGGGSIAWIDPELGTLRVGPQSAGADPGPACYGHGGTDPTVTDAAVALGYVARLGSQLELDATAARDAIQSNIAEPLGLEVERAAEGILEVAAEQMRELVRRVTVQRGHDPSDFALYAFGGAGPQYVGRYASELGAQEVVVPLLAAEFSAFGAARCDLRAGVRRDLRPGPLAERIATANEALAELEGEARRQLEGTETKQSPSISRVVGLRFHRQLESIDVPLTTQVLDVQDLHELLEAFYRRYEEIVGKGSAPADTPVEIVSVAVDVTVDVPTPVLPRRSTEFVGTRGKRHAWFDNRVVECAVFEWESLGVGQRVSGPAFVESPRTTLVVYPGQSVVVDERGDLRMEVADAG